MKPCVLLSLLLACLTSVAAPARWPQFRGPNSSGVDESGKPPIEFGPGTNLLWRTPVAAGLSSPCVWNDHVFLTSVEEGKLTTLALDGRTGRILWRQGIAAASPREMHKRNHPAAATPATDGNSVCVYHAGWGLVSYDFAGRELWRKPMPGLLTRNGSGTSPALLDGKLVLNCDVEEGKSFLAAFDPSTGKELWRTSRAQFISGYTTPVRWQRDGADDVVISGSLKVTGYSLSDGRQRWSIGGNEAVSVCPTPVTGDGQLYVMSRSMSGSRLPPWGAFAVGVDKDADGKISRAEIPGPFVEQGMFSGIDGDQDGFITETEWAKALALLQQADFGIFALKPPGEGELSTNHVAWAHKKGVANVSSALFYRGRVYVVQDGGRLTSFEGGSGRKIYEQERLGAEGDYYASPVAANGHLYCCSSKGVVTTIAAGDTLQVKARNPLGEAIHASPAIAGDTLYIRSEAHLWAFASR